MDLIIERVLEAAGSNCRDGSTGRKLGLVSMCLQRAKLSFVTVESTLRTLMRAFVTGTLSFF